MPLTTRNTLQFLVVLAFIALIVFSPSVHFISYLEFNDCQRVLQLLLLALVLLDGVFTGLNKSSIMPVNHKFKIGFFVLLALSIASAVRAIEPRYAAIEISVFAALCYLALFVARLYTEHKEVFIKYLTYALWASITLYMLSFYTGYITAMAFKKPLAWPHPFYGFSNIRLFQQYQLWSLGLICLPLLTFDLKRNTRLWLYFALTCWWVLLFYGASRGVVLSWIVAIILTALVYKKLAWAFLRIQIITAFAGLCAYQALFKLIPSWIISNEIVTNTIFRNTMSDRTDLWKVALVMIKNFPCLGVGPMHFYIYNTFGAHPHNSVIQIAAEWGLLATVLMLAMLAYGFYCWMKKFNASQLQTTTQLNSHLAMILFFTITSNAAYSLVDGVIVMPISQVLMFTMIGLMVGQYAEKTRLVKVAESTKFKLRFRPIFAGIVLVAMVLSTMPELIRGLTSSGRILSAGERAFSMGPGVNPRLWMQQKRGH